VQQSVRHMYSALAAGLVIALLFTACDTEPPPPTETPTMVILAASPTVNPLAAVGDEDQLDAEAQEGTRIALFTPAAPLLSSDGSTITPTPAPTEAMLSMQFAMEDGVTIVAAYYPASGSGGGPAPAVLMIHDINGRKEDWQPVAERFQRAGIIVLSMDMRGFGLTGGDVDWAKTIEDAKTILSNLRTLRGVDPARVSVLGAGIGASVALSACARLPQDSCHLAILISPAPSNQDIDALSAMSAYGSRPLFIAASKADGTAAIEGAALDKRATGEHRLEIYDGNARGAALLASQSALIDTLARSLVGQIQWGG